MIMMYDIFQTASLKIIKAIETAERCNDIVAALKAKYQFALLKADYYDQHVDTSGADHSESQLYIKSQAERAWREVGDCRDAMDDAGIEWRDEAI